MWGQKQRCRGVKKTVVVKRQDRTEARTKAVGG